MFYAQLNEENICIGISQLSGEVKAENMIEIETHDVGLLNKRWTRQGWEEVPRPEQEAPAPTVDRLARLETQNLILMDTLATVYVETLGDKADDQTLTDLYTPLVEAGRKTVGQVPEKIKDAVQGRLLAKGDGGVKDAN